MKISICYVNLLKRMVEDNKVKKRVAHNGLMIKNVSVFFILKDLSS